MAKWYLLTTIVVILDQITKQIAENSLSLYERVAVMPFFNFTLAYNEGAAFSFLADAGGWQRWFFVGLTLVISSVLIIWLKKSDNKIEQLAISFVLAGAIGNNLIDRPLFGHVIDFIDVYYESHHWPAFNIADMAISAGVMLLIYVSLTDKSVSSRKA
ncbi:MAG: signal peptidase II [Gammaproteobacteria bacterium]|nr:signal peptidase II [Gammaproteobacteria bacterium]